MAQCIAVTAKGTRCKKPATVGEHCWQHSGQHPKPAGDGRPTDYKPEYDEQAYKLCLLGAKDEQLADFFGVCVATLNNWKNQFPTFLEALKNGKIMADAEIAKSMYHNAKGYSHKAVKHVTHEGKVTDVFEYEEHYPPNPTAGIFWLKNRQPDLWREKKQVEITDGTTIDVTLEDDEE